LKGSDSKFRAIDIERRRRREQRVGFVFIADLLNPAASESLSIMDFGSRTSDEQIPMLDGDGDLDMVGAGKSGLFFLRI
jgi:hypothetical protein